MKAIFDDRQGNPDPKPFFSNGKTALVAEGGCLCGAPAEILTSVPSGFEGA